jgi:sulfur relay (sulfurtransferase) DsrC/TusE family protein
MDMQPIEPRRPMTVQLTAEQWNVVMFVMRKHQLPFEVSAPIIDSMGQQLQQQSQPRFAMEDADNA